MASGSAEGSVSTPPMIQIVDPAKPLWSHVIQLERTGGSGGNAKSKCRYCDAIIHGSYFRVKAHLLKISNCGVKTCPKVTVPILQQLRDEVAAAEAATSSAATRRVPLPGENTSSNEVGSASQMGVVAKKRKGQLAIDKSFNLGLRSTMDALVARAFYTAGLPFNLARNPYWREMIMYACNNPLNGYVPPAYNRMRTTLLQQERTHVEGMLVPIKTTWSTKGVSIASDGWSDAQRRPLINFLAVTEGGPMFLRAINTEGEVKNKEYIAEKMVVVIEEVGAKNVVQVITDNAPVCKAAGMIIEQKYNHIFWTPCVVHTLNLALKNICAGKSPDGTIHEEFQWIMDVAGDATIIKNFIMNHSLRLAMFNEFSKLKLLAIAETRFASTIIMLKRFYFIRSALKQMVICDMWDTYKDDSVGTAQFVKEKILNDVWWGNVKYLIEFTEPIYSMLREVDTDKSCLHLVYEMWDSMIEKVKDAIYKWEGKEPHEDCFFYFVIHNILVDRWGKSNTPLHCLAHSLNPRYYTESWIQGGPNRQFPHDDNEINKNVLKCLRKFFPITEQYRKLKAQFADFSQFGEGFDSFESIEDRAHLKPKQWWSTHGGSAPELRALALKLLGQPSSSSCCERNWSTYGFIHSMKRNKMTPQRAEDLVFVHTNLRLLSRKSEKYNHGPTRMWDVGADAHESFTSGVGILEIANLSLDEPELEMELCEDATRDDDAETTMDECDE